MNRRRYSLRPRGFTLIELLVVIGIIVLLISILVPVVSQVRKAASDTSTQGQMQRIMQACESYYHDFNAYPGPIANANLSGGSNATAASSLAPPIMSVSGGSGQITSSENLVLGLLGFLNPPTTGSPNITFVPMATNPPHDVYSLSTLHPATYHYIDYVPTEVTDFETSLQNMQGLKSTDTNVPEFIDRFPKPLPILYMRANVGNAGIASTTDTTQYNYAELNAYGCNIPLSDGTGSQTVLVSMPPDYFNNINSIATSTTNPLSDEVASPYFDYNAANKNASGQYDGWLANPNIAGSARGKDGFILIAAGKDRVYGTHDDTIITP
jgi:prepilin-type N-terminal cleavage/methylation domain-containing protein